MEAPTQEPKAPRTRNVEPSKFIIQERITGEVSPVAAAGP